MKGRRRGLAVVLFAAWGALALGLPALAQDSPTPADETVTFTIGTTTDIRTVNPFRQVTVTEAWVSASLYDSLIEYKREDLSSTAGLAESWTQSDDGLTWTFKLREGLLWSDGEALTAHDFEWFANYVVENKIGQFIDYFPFTEPGGVVAVDDLTVEWTTTQPTVQPGLPGPFPLPEHIWGEMTVKESRQYESFPDGVVSGGWMLTEWEPGQFWKLEPNPNYWREGEPAVDEYVFRVFNTDETVVQALQRGTIDFAEYIPGALFQTLEGRPGIETHVGGYAQFTNLNFNLGNDTQAESYSGHPALHDLAVRQAIAHAINREELIEKVLRGYGTPGTTIMVPAFPFWHYEPTPEEQYQFDLAEANRLLDEAGYLDTDDDGIREMPDGGEPLEFRLMTVASDSDSSKMTPFIEGWLEQIGIGVETDPVNNTTLLGRYYDLDFDMYIYGWATSPDPDFMLSTFTEDQCLVWSDTCWSDPTFQELYEAQRDATNPEERQQLVFDAQLYLYEQNPEMVLFYTPDLQAYRSDRWTGFVDSPDPEGYLLDQYTMYSMRSVRPLSADVTSAAESEGGISGIVWIGLAVAVVLLIVGAVVAGRRRDRA